MSKLYKLVNKIHATSSTVIAVISVEANAALREAKNPKFYSNCMLKGLMGEPLKINRLAVYQVKC